MIEPVRSIRGLHQAAEATLSKRRDPEPAAAPAPEPDGEPKKDRLERYHEALADYAYRIENHQSEPVDAAWSKPLAESIESQLSQKSKKGSFELKGVDCRSKTCVATVTYPSPAEAIKARSQSNRYLPVKGCKGMSTVLPPPKGDGPYELSVLYTCR